MINLNQTVKGSFFINIDFSNTSMIVAVMFELCITPTEINENCRGGGG